MRLPLLLTALTLPLQAIEFEGPREVTDFSSYYRQLLPADLDGDGRQDFIAGAVPVLAKAGGIFQALPAFAVEPSQEVRSWFADLDGDGDADGVIASVGDTTQLDLTENLGGGNFGPLESLGPCPREPTIRSACMPVTSTAMARPIW